MPKIMDNNQMGKMVLFLNPTPNCRILPSVLYKNFGCAICIEININKNNNIATTVGWFLI
jgi:hypothetical protein